MKSNLHFYKWLVAVIVLVCSTLTMSAQTIVTSLGQLKAGCVIKIYPKGSYGISHYYESEYALACSGDEQPLTSYEKAGSGDEWTMEDAGDGFCYIKNDKGCFWTYQGSSSSESLKCTTDKSSAVRIALTWDSAYNGLCFWNEKDGKGLNNLYEYYYRYNWWSDPKDYSIDANTTFDIVLLKEGNGNGFSGDKSREIILNGIKYRLNVSKTAEVLANDYSGDIIIPENVTYNDVTYRITSLENGCFNDCSYLKSISLPDGITSLGKNCFYSCDNLTSISLPEGLTSLGDNCFAYCYELTSISLPDGITSLGNECFVNCSSLTSMLCFAVEPPICYTNVVDKTTRLYVPKESIEKYEQKVAWNGAKGIYPLYPTDSISLPKEVSVILAKPTKIEYTILPENAGTKELKWSSEDPEVATVDENGVVTGMKLGETVITATATDDSIVSATCKVTVMPSTAINGITIGNIKMTVENRCLKVEGLADNDIIKISDYAGSTVYRGTEHNIYLNASGVYIVEVKGTTLKIHVK